MNKFRREVAELLKGHIQIDDSIIEVPPIELGDFAVPCFSMAKEMKKDSGWISEQIENYTTLTKNYLLK